MPTFNLVMIITITLVMIVVMIESTGMFLALGDMTGKPVTRPMLSAGLRTDGLGTLIGGIFKNAFFNGAKDQTDAIKAAASKAEH